MKTPDRICPQPFDPAADCAACPRLVGLRHGLRRGHPTWFNGAVPSFGDPDAWLLIVGLAPGMQGANRTGRPFTGDYAGDLLYATLGKFGLAQGSYDQRVDDSLKLKGVMLTNAVHCLPPDNKPVGDEINRCRPYLTAAIDGLPRLRTILSLGKIAHDSVVRALGARLALHPFGHNAHYRIGGRAVAASYHCSRYNTNTRRLTPEMFEAVFEKLV